MFSKVLLPSIIGAILKRRLAESPDFLGVATVFTGTNYA
jgi:hypothetical protein